MIHAERYSRHNLQTPQIISRGRDQEKIVCSEKLVLLLIVVGTVGSNVALQVTGEYRRIAVIGNIEHFLVMFVR